MSGRPTLHTAEIAERILDELSGGRTLREVCRDEGMPRHNTVRGWVIADREDFAARYKRAREVGYHSMADEIIEIADDSRNVDHGQINRSWLRVKARQWLLSKTLPKTYGNRPDPNPGHEVTDTLAAVLREINGKTRGLPNAEPPPEDGAESAGCR